MKKVRMGLIALAMMVSIGGAFATRSNVNSKAQLYGVTGKSGSNYIVVADDGSGSCDPSSNVCTVMSTFTPTGGQLPISETTNPEPGDYNP